MSQLELGAGVGGTTIDVAPVLDGADVDYLFTDVSTFFLTAAQERFADHPWMRFGLLDMNAEPAVSGLGDGTTYDVILAANVLHNAHDVGDVVHRLRDAITDGGLLVFVESCREHYQLLTSMHSLMSPRPGQPAAGERGRRAGEDTGSSSPPRNGGPNCAPPRFGRCSRYRRPTTRCRCWSSSCSSPGATPHHPNRR